jgi:hypothetical protein
VESTKAHKMAYRLVERVLAGLSWKIFLVYLGNINVFSIISKTSDEHLMKLNIYMYYH